MATVDERERDDEELADYDVGVQDRIECEPWEASPGEDLVLSKGMTEERTLGTTQVDARVKSQPWSGLGARVGCCARIAESRTQAQAAVGGPELDSHLLLKLLSDFTGQ